MIDCGTFVLRPFHAADRDALVQIADDPSVAANLRDRFPHPYTPADADAWLAHVDSEQPTRHFAIARDHTLLGSIGLEVQSDVNRLCAEVGYYVGRQHRGQGIATAATVAATDYAFATLGMQRVFAIVFESNPGSARVLERAGFVLEGRLRRAILKAGRVMDALLYARVQ